MILNKNNGVVSSKYGNIKEDHIRFFKFLCRSDEAVQ